MARNKKISKVEHVGKKSRKGGKRKGHSGKKHKMVK